MAQCITDQNYRPPSTWPIEPFYGPFVSFSFNFVGFYGISTFVGYLMPNPFAYKWTVQFQTIQFSISKQFNYKKHFYLKQFSLVKQF